MNRRIMVQFFVNLKQVGEALEAQHIDHSMRNANTLIAHMEVKAKEAAEWALAEFTQGKVNVFPKIEENKEESNV